MKSNHITLFILMTLFNVTIATSQTDYNDVADIFYTNCTPCHNSDGIAPFPMTSYAEINPYSSSINNSVDKGEMPPWQPDSTYSHFLYSTELTSTERSAIMQWVADGSLEGNSALAPPAPVCPTESHPNLLAGEADLVVGIGEVTSNSSGGNPNPYNCYVVDLGLTQGRWLRAGEIKPGNYSAVHHVVISCDTTNSCSDNTNGYCYSQCGDFGVAGWSAGAAPVVYPNKAPAKLGMWFPAGSKLVFQLHYAPGSGGEIDSTKFRMYFYDQDSLADMRPVVEEVILQEWGFNIPANTVQNVIADETAAGPDAPNMDYSIFAVNPHSHTACTSIVNYAFSGTDTIPLIRIDNWDYNWEGYYYPPYMIKIPNSYVLQSEHVFDNTVNNSRLITDPNNPISAGIATEDEMLFDSFTYTEYQAGDENIDLAALLADDPIFSKKPTGALSDDITTCKDASGVNITFTGLQGTAPYKFTYKINDGAYQSVETTGTNSTVSVSVPTNNLGTFNYYLVAVGDSINCTSTNRDTAIVIINAGPTGTISGETSVCNGGTEPNITLKAQDGTGPYTITYTINAGSNQTVVTGAGDSVIITAPTNTSGDFTYALVSVADATCTANATDDITITVVDDIIGTISGGTTVCQGSTSPTILFTGSGGTAPYTFTYAINAGSNQTVATASNSNTVTVSALTSSNGTLTYSLSAITDNTLLLCTSASGSEDIVVEVAPTASAGGSATICENGNTIVSGASSSDGTINWTHNGNGSITNATTVTPTYSADASDAGNNVILTMTVTGSGNCSSATAAAIYTITVNPLPTASAGGSETICSNGTATVSGASSSNGTINWTHDGSGTLSNEATVAPTYTPVGGDAGNTVILTMTVTSNNACTAQDATATFNVIIDNASGTTGTLSGGTTVCQGTTAPLLTFSGSNGTAPYTFTYAMDGGSNQTVTTSGGASTVNISAPTNAAGTFNYVLSAISDVGAGSCSSASGNETIVVNPLATSSAGSNASICVTGSRTVNDASSNGTNSWTHNGNGTLINTTGLSPTYTPVATDANTSVTLTLSVTNSCSPTPVTSTSIINVDSLPIAFAGVDSIICINNSYTVTDANANYGSILWTHDGSGTLSNENSITPNYSPDENDGGESITLSLTLTSNNACSSATTNDNLIVIIDTLSNSSVVCPPAKPTLTNTNGTLTSSPGNGYLWYKDGELIDGVTTQSYIPTENGTYTLVITNGNGNSEGSDPIVITTITSPPTKPIITNNQGTLTSNHSTGNQWYLNGVPIPQATGATFTPIENGTYTLIITNSGGSSIPSDEIAVTVSSIDVTETLSILSIFPNPASSTVTVNLNTPLANGTLAIVNLLGTDVKNLSFDGTMLTIDVSNITPGVYFIMIKEGQNIVVVEKLVVEAH